MEKSKTSITKQTRPDEIVDELIARIFVGEFKAGDQLPPSRSLATELGVDRTSLRIALRQLARMNVIRPLQGSGITVLDYREHAGIEFIASVFALPDMDLGGAFLLEALGLWNQVMPAICARVVKRATPSDYQRLDLLFAKQLDLIDQKSDMDNVVELELEIQDTFVKVYGSAILVLIANTTIPVRRTLVRMLFETVDPHKYVEAQREQLRIAMMGKVTPEEIVTTFRDFLHIQGQPLLDKLAELPISPSRTKRKTPSKAPKKRKKT